MSKRVAIVQSNYIPWKGYFDMIASVDEFILFDDVQFTRRDWRTRNQIKTPHGVEWLSVPVGGPRDRRIRDVAIPDPAWQAQHWKTLEHHYKRAPHFAWVEGFIRPLYMERVHTNLSAMNRLFLETVMRMLGITTRLTNSWDYSIRDGKTERLLDLCQQAGATTYVSGPSAKEYLDETLFAAQGVAVAWFDYGGYPEYPQSWGPFTHTVSILDLLFHCGEDAPTFMHCGKP